MSTTSQAGPWSAVANESPDAAHGLGQAREQRGKLEHRRQFVEGRDAGREAERADIHVAVDEAPAGDERARRDACAAGRAEVDDERRPAALAAAGARAGASARWPH